MPQILPRIDPKRLKFFRELRDEGKSIKECTTIMKMSRVTAWRWDKLILELREKHLKRKDK